jgi:GNAT superfamily N-acetyltransferase
MTERSPMTELRVAGPDDADEVGRIWGDGFSEDPVLTWVFREPDQAAKLQAFFTFLAGEVHIGMGATTMTDGGCAGWTPPEPEPWSDETGAAFGALLGGMCSEPEITRLGVLDELTNAHHPSEPHWYLSILAVDHDHRSQGLGGRLLAHTLQTVDAAGMPAYLESTNPRNVTLYERHGFEVTEEVTIPDGPRFTCMWREARPAR